MVNYGSPSAVRNCGLVHPNQLHAMIKPGVEGSIPWSAAVVDPVQPVVLTELGVASQGIFLKERVEGYNMETGEPQYLVDPITGGIVYDLYDVIGDGYPNAWDFIVEWAFDGMHRLMPTNTNLSLLSPKSEYRGIHMKAHLRNAKDLYPHRLYGVYDKCYAKSPEIREMHIDPTADWLEYQADTCASLLYNCITGKRGEREKGTRNVKRSMVLAEYEAFAPPDDFTPEWGAGWFFQAPLGQLVYWSLFRDRTDPEALEKVNKQYDSIYEGLKRQVIVDVEDLDEKERV